MNTPELVMPTTADIADVCGKATGKSADFDLSSEFPAITCPVNPCGHYVVVQLPKPRTMIGSIYVAPASERNQKYDNMMAMVLSIGPMAYCHDSGAAWTSGPWCAKGDLVLIPQYIGQKFLVIIDDGEVELAMLRDADIIGRVKMPELIKRTV